MLRFKTFLSEGLLKEYLTAGQKEAFSNVKMTNKARKDTDHFFGVGNDLVKEPLIPDYQKSETHEDVENHLGISIPAEHYIKGVATDKYGRLSKIGKQIKDSSLLQTQLLMFSFVRGTFHTDAYHYFLVDQEV